MSDTKQDELQRLELIFNQYQAMIQPVAARIQQLRREIFCESLPVDWPRIGDEVLVTPEAHALFASNNARWAIEGEFEPGMVVKIGWIERYDRKPEWIFYSVESDTRGTIGAIPPDIICRMRQAYLESIS